VLLFRCLTARRPKKKEPIIIGIVCCHYVLFAIAIALILSLSLVLPTALFDRRPLSLMERIWPIQVVEFRERGALRLALCEVETRATLYRTGLVDIVAGIAFRQRQLEFWWGGGLYRH